MYFLVGATQQRNHVATLLRKHSLLVLEGKASDIGTRLKASWADALIANWGLWVPAQVVNFRFVPPIYQVLFANGVGFIWNIILSFLSFKPVEKDKGRGVPIGD
mmetsp:Transcript_3103/g.5309  ORF Transcript_3103/g.5309 Transcript_3103/m.5309 type:complete len:104 (+) Transcript_3103:488-799(+)